MKTAMSFLWSTLGTLNMLSHKYKIVQYLYKKLNVTLHLFAHGSPHVCHCCCHFILLRLVQHIFLFFMKTTMSFLSSILTTLNILSHNYIIVQYLYKISNATPHFFAHGSPYLCDFYCHIFFSLRLGPTDSFFFLHEDCNVIFLVYIIYIEHVVSYLHNCLVFVLKFQRNSPLLCTWFPTCL